MGPTFGCDARRHQLARPTKRKSFTSGGSGGLRATQELLDFCAEHGVGAEVEVLPSAEVGTALARLEANDVRYRFVLDLADLDDPTG